jgi:hypothetical protein
MSGCLILRLIRFDDRSEGFRREGLWELIECVWHGHCWKRGEKLEQNMNFEVLPG